MALALIADPPNTAGTGTQPWAVCGYAANAQAFGKWDSSIGQVQAHNQGPGGDIDASAATALNNISSNFTDGTSNTIIFTDKLANCGTGYTSYGAPNSDYWKGSTCWAWNPQPGTPNTGGDYLDQSQPFIAAIWSGYNPIFWGKYYAGGVGYNNHSLTIQSPSISWSSSQCDARIASSGHAVGVNVGMADGSVHMVTIAISPLTWWYALTPQGGEVLGSDW